MNAGHTELKAAVDNGLIAGHEKSLIAHLMSGRDACDKFLHRVSPNVLSVPVHSVMLDAIRDVYDERDEMNFITVSNRLAELGKLAQCGGPAGITDIAVSTTSEEIAGSALECILDAYRVRESSKIGKQLHEGAITGAQAVEQLSRLDAASCDALPTPCSIIALAELAPETFEADNLLGSRFLCFEGGMLFVGPSGIGKSSANVQQDICFALGRPAFGIHPTRPLRILCVQAENDDGDLAEMSRGVCDHLNLTDEERKLVHERVVYINEKAATGGQFLRLLRRLVQKYKPDIIRIDPLHAFAGGDVCDPAVTTPFLRNGLNPILQEFRCAAIVCHHTPKTTYRDTSKWNATDWMYAGAGNADVTNWARAILVIESTKVHGAYVFRAAKRGSRIGWADDNGHRVYDRLFCHNSGDAIFWRDATGDDIERVLLAKAKKGEPPKTREELKALVPLDEDIPKLALIQRANMSGFGLNLAKRLLADLIANKELHEVRRPRKGTCPEALISRREETLI